MKNYQKQNYRLIMSSGYVFLSDPDAMVYGYKIDLQILDKVRINLLDLRNKSVAEISREINETENDSHFESK